MDGSTQILIEPLNKSDIQSAFDFTTEIFVSGSTLHRALNIDLGEYRDYFYPSFVEMVSESLSVTAKDKATGTLLGCLIVTDFYQQSDSSLENLPDTNSKFAPLTALTAELNNAYRLHYDLAPDSTILVDMAAVARNAQGKGIYRKMREAAHKVAEENGYQNVVGELSSVTTQHFILEKLGHERIVEIKFGKFEWNGSHPFRSIEEPSSIILARGDL